MAKPRAPVFGHLFEVTVYPPVEVADEPFAIGCSRVSEFTSDARVEEFDEMTSGIILKAPAKISLGDITLSRATCGEDKYQALYAWHYEGVVGNKIMGSFQIKSRGPKGTKSSGQDPRYALVVGGWISRISLGPWDAGQSGVLMTSVTMHALWASWISGDL